MQETSITKTLFRSLRHRNFRLFWSGQLVSLIGTWMQNVGQAWLVLELTHSSLKLGIVSALQFLPMLFLSLFTGPFIDYFDKRRIIIWTQAALMTLAFVLSVLVWTGTVQYWHVVVLATLLGIVNTIDMPATAGVHHRSGREGRPHERHRAQLVHLQRGPRNRSGARRDC